MKYRIVDEGKTFFRRRPFIVERLIVSDKSTCWFPLIGDHFYPRRFKTVEEAEEAAKKDADWRRDQLIDHTVVAKELDL